MPPARDKAATSARDARHLSLCLTLAARGAGRTSPNPMVGAVVVRGGRIVARAYHRGAGLPHAEADALRRAGRLARGATLYVNLEPCSHFGRTPPCVRAIVAAGVRRVVACHRDPFRQVNGRGFAALRRAGIQVDVGILREEAERLNEAYLRCVATGRPFVHVKAAISLDGRLATVSGASRWISGEGSRRAAHRMRAISDAILVGVGTVLADDPRLTVRMGRGGRGAHGPLKVVMDSRLRVPNDARLVARARPGSVIIYCIRQAPPARQRQLARLGVVVVPVRSDGRGRPRLRDALRDLSRRGVTRVLLEGGGELIASALEGRLVDKVSLFVAPLILGGRDAVPFAGGAGVRRIAQAPRLHRPAIRRIGTDLLIEGALVPGG
ncbi:MAG: bifunctional diaminohydroxyphosphoribosylaminopyrimidine deaminase/5-amino-6-(5-phosphoribosylamino)uracil reductase RibD [Candidatus Polarisedimenticolia bacterium]